MRCDFNYSINPFEALTSITNHDLSYFTQLYALKQRLAVLNQGRKVTEAQIPAAPSHLVRAFREAISDLHVDTKPKIVLYALYDKFVLRQLQGLYEEINNNFKNAGILPNLKPAVIEPGDRLDPRTLESESRGESPGNISAISDDGRGDNTPRGGNSFHIRDNDGGGGKEARRGPATAADQRSGLGEELFDSILELMSRRRGGYRPTAANSGHYGDGTHRQLLSAVDQIRPLGVGGGRGVLSDLEALPKLAVAPQFLDVVKQALTYEREQIFSQVDRNKVQPIDADTIDLVGMLFEYMLNDPLLPNVVKALISYLHTPYLKLALTDQELLIDSEHPARIFLDLLVEAGGLWVYESDIKRGIFPQMQQAVDRVLREALDNPGLFSELLDYVRAAMDEQRHKSDTLERRSQEILKGKERLLGVKKQAAQAITTCIRQVPLPKPIKRFLDEAWTDRLVFILLRHKEGKRSPEWLQALRVADDLVGLFDPESVRVPRRKIADTGLLVLDEIRATMESLGGYHQHHLDELFQFLNNPQSVIDWRRQPNKDLNSDLPFEDNKPRQEGVPAIPNPSVVTVSGAIAAQSALRKTLIPSQPPLAHSLSEREQEMLDKLRRIKFGTWFELQSDSGVPRRLKLSWLSPLTDSCMFVDRSGVQAEVKGLAEIAGMLVSGKARVLPQPRRGFVQRTLVLIKNALKQSVEATS